MFIGSIAPPLCAYLLVQAFHCGLSQTIGKSLREHALVIVILIVGLHRLVHGGCKGAYGVGHAVRKRTYEVGKTQRGVSFLCWRLLAQHREPQAVYNDVVAIGVGIKQSEHGMCGIARLHRGEHLHGLFAQGVLLSIRLS